MIELKNVTKAFGTNILFSGLTFDIKDGEFVVFSGKSGCGKSTMLNMIGGIEKVTNGSIIVDGMDITKNYNRVKYFSEKVGFLFQNFALSENKTVLKNLEMVAKKNRTEVSIDDALREVGLLSKKNEKVFTLSGGEQQRVALARLMIKKCDMILADEPTGSLDKGNANTVIDILKKLNEKGKTVIMVTHDEELKKVGKRVIVLDDV
ncbi:bacteriocin ABC transporter ATP-binding protein [Ruminococcus albus SY3]|uniref:Bacteriocin ABC transporter ATP-binding protein n=1 Tax=Ruminococcus albus SY3 TaxID=1341156 RepID=A0A011UX10_RUMAL|nr:ABC transporter ATP-binding protein [Ruminococcus albus]EXM37747.1 bacteriocin ABC transporter ATP-binding protein [Ruminococcus albus SY3]